MSDGISLYLANAWLGTLGGTSFSVSARYLQLHTGSPGYYGTSHVSAGDSSRKSVTFGSPANGAIMASNSPTWTNGGITEVITELSLWDASSSGHFLRSVQLAAPITWVSTNTLSLDAFGLSLSPMAGS